MPCLAVNLSIFGISALGRLGNPVLYIKAAAPPPSHSRPSRWREWTSSPPPRRHLATNRRKAPPHLHQDIIDENNPVYTKMKLPKVSRFQSLGLYGFYFFMGVGLGGIGGYYIASWCVAAAPSAEEGNTTAEVPLTTTTLPLTNEEKINLQENMLRSIVCEPESVMEKIVSHLEYHDEVADREYYPEVVAVYRCLEDRGFCGNPRLGKSYGPCLPDRGAIKLRSFSVYYYEGREMIFKEVLVPEHTACMCPNK